MTVSIYRHYSISLFDQRLHVKTFDDECLANKWINKQREYWYINDGKYPSIPTKRGFYREVRLNEWEKIR